MSATNPENGAVTYTYDGAHHVLSRTDAKGQVTGYSYDAYGRLTAVAHYPTGIANGADSNQQVTYYYDTNPYGDPIANATWGRLAAVAFGSACQQPATPANIYMYGYNPAGRVTGQKMRVSVNQSNPSNWACGPYTVDQRASYGWDTEGRMTSLTYPGNTNALTYTYDAMGHLKGMTDSMTGASASATYGTAGEMDSLGYRGFYGNFTYNSLWQLTGDGVMQYVYPAGQNNGRITQSISGSQTVNYTYDSLNRLASAQATDGSWGQAYGYDGFGNLTAKTVTAGSAMQFSASYFPATNNGGGTDANGNVLEGPLDPATGNWIAYTYDVENRIIWSCELSTCYTLYGYDPQGKRVLRQTGVAAGPAPLTGTYSSEFTFYGITGQRLSTFSVTSSNYGNSGYCNAAWYCTWGPNAGYLYFGGRLISQPNGTTVLTDRLGSQRNGMSYYPWGEEKTSTPSGQVKFATYFRDMPGQDYADQRYYTATAGRFYTADPAALATADLKNPTTWNMYAYANDDPVNLNDPHGMFGCVVWGWTAAAATSLGAVSDQLKAAASQQSIFTPEQLDCISGIETGRTWNPNIVAKNGRVGLFQFNQANWTACGTAISWDNGSAAKNPQTAAEVTLALLYRKLGYGGVQDPTDAAIQQAIDNFGEGDGRYGKAAMDCAKQLQAGDFVGAYNTLQSYANWVAAGRP